MQIKPEMQFTVERCIQEKNKISQRQKEVSVDDETYTAKERQDCANKNMRRTLTKRVMNHAAIQITCFHAAFE